ncbi:MAG: hypothetical protein Q4D32_06075, partial [Eubacteriales bacterium]|nr:hypothetical protein [Eubacteriales bacterium]
MSWEKSDKNICSGELKFYVSTQGENAAKGTFAFSGYIWESGEKPEQINYSGTMDVSFLQPWNGYYKTWVNDGSQSESGKELVIQAGKDSESSKVFYGGTEIHNFTYAVPTMTWNEGGGNDTSAVISFYGTDLPAFTGKICQKGGTLPAENNFFGTYDDKYLSEWSGYYSSMLKEETTYINGPEMILMGAVAGGDSTLYVDGKEIKNISFNNPVMSWNDEENDTNGLVIFYYSQTNKRKEFVG